MIAEPEQLVLYRGTTAENPGPVCQYCLADPRFTPLGSERDKRCPVCGVAYSGPRRGEEFRVLVEAGLVAKGD